MAGRAEIEEQDKGILDRCLLFTRKGNWELAANPLNIHSNVRKAPNMQRLGPGWTFAQTMLAANEDQIIGLVVNAKGGSAIEPWLDDGKLYQATLKRIKQASEHGIIAGVLWHQGK